MTVLATLVALYSAMVLGVASFRPPFIRERMEIIPLAIMAHIAGGLVAMAIGAWQLNARLRDRARGAHRWMGRVYAIAVLIGGLGALRMAMVSQFGLVTHVGYGMLATLWLWTTLRAWVAIRAGDEATHRRWMIRSYALTLAAVTLRLYLPLAAVLGAPYVEAYQVVSWLCWVPNLIIAEWVVLRREGLSTRSAVIGVALLALFHRTAFPQEPQTIGGSAESARGQGQSALRDHHFLLLVPAPPGEWVSVELWPTPVTQTLGVLDGNPPDANLR